MAPVLATSVRKPAAEIARLLEGAPKGITDFAASILSGQPASATLVLFVDQLEELFTIVAERYRAPFTELLAHAAGDARMRVLATLRADFMPQCAKVPALAALFQAGTFVLGPPGPAEMADMIRKPANRAGVELKNGLADELLRDAGDDPGALPLLGFSLEELYRQSVDPIQHGAQTALRLQLTVADYNALGRLRGAIGQRAEALLEDIRKTTSADVDAVLQGLFHSLVYVDATGVATRRRAVRNQLQTKSPSPHLAEDLYERLIRGPPAVG